MGGRLYCASDDNWQSRNSDARSLITINGQDTVELDISASHMVVLHGITRKPLDTTVDPYDLEGVERDVVKNVFSAWCGLGRSPRRWPKKFREEYAQRKGRELNQVYKLKNVVAALRTRHPALNKIKSGSLDWSKLQFEESECFLSVMLDLQRNFEVPALPVFDSLIVPEKDSGLTTEILKSAYQDRFGIRPQVRCK
ncbi:MAG: hypothetical protein CMK09_15785 [Ponticaulis sp.]|nr:hypothetical protein [Ponticaulis sp.]